MALVKCEHCSQMVANTGKCPKCGTLICTECGHSLSTKDVKCPNCGRGTDSLKQKIKGGWIMLVVGLLMLFIHPSPGDSSFIAFMNIIGAVCGLFFIVMGLYHLLKYGKIKHYS